MFAKMYEKLVILGFIASLSTIDTARILAVFPTPSISHQVVFRVLTKELAKRGHEVVVITTDPAFTEGQAPSNLTEIDVHYISYNFMKDLMSDMTTEFGYGKEMPWITIEKEMRRMFTVLKVQVKSEPVQKLIKEKRKFDVLLIEAYMRPALAFVHVFKAPVILVSSFGATLENLEAFGAPTHPVLYPTPFCQRLYNLSLWDKFREIYYHAVYLYEKKYVERLDDELSQQLFGKNIPSVSELYKNVDLLFVNVHPIWMDNQPVPPGIIFMGGLHQKPIKQLPQDLQSYLDSSKNGVVYVSFGTNFHPKLVPVDRVRVITEALSELPYDVLFKWSDVERPVFLEGLKISKFLSGYHNQIF